MKIRRALISVSDKTGVAAFARALEGQGVGNKLAKYVLDYAVEKGYMIQPLCPFIGAYVRRHPEYQAHVWHT